MRIPIDMRRELEPFLRGRSLDWDSIEVDLVAMSYVYMEFPVPHALVKRSVMLVTAEGSARGLKPVGMTIAQHIFLDKDHADFDTAAGLALLVHELVHVDQWKTDPNFDRHYQQMAAQTPDDTPWGNPYEREAYLAERQAYCGYVAMGVPKGRWTPLGIHLWGAC